MKIRAKGRNAAEGRKGGGQFGERGRWGETLMEGGELRAAVRNNES